MRKPDYRSFKSGQVHHVYIRGKAGWVIFYSVEDCIVFYTLYMILARKYGITVYALCIMPNHIHAAESAPDGQAFIAFHMQLESQFAREYNIRHGRTGHLFDESFGFAPKLVGKKVRETLSYIMNNPVVGKLSNNALDYRWNLLAYCESSHPFSTPARLSSATKPFRRAIWVVDCQFERGLHLRYGMLESIFRKITRSEKQQLIDHIIHRYNRLDYSILEKQFGSFEKALLVFESSSGSEHDIQEDWDDYSVYTEMIRIMSSCGEDLRACNFEKKTKTELDRLVSGFKSKGFSQRSISKFLHLPWRLNSCISTRCAISVPRFGRTDN